MERACSVARSDYYNRMNEVLDSARFLNTRTLGQAHLVTVTELFRDIDANYQQHDDFYQHKITLARNIEHIYVDMVSINERNNKEAVNEAVKQYESRMNQFCGPEPQCVHPLDLEEESGRARAAAIRQFQDQRSAACQDQPDDCFNRRLNTILKRYFENLKERNETRNNNAVWKAFKCYEQKAKRESANFLGMLFRGRDFSVSSRHGPAKADSLKMFENLRRNGPSRDSDVYRTDLLEKKEKKRPRHYLREIFEMDSAIEHGRSVARDDFSARMSRVRDSARCVNSRLLAQAYNVAATEVLRNFDATYQQHDDFYEQRGSLSQDIENSYQEFESNNERINRQAVDEAFQRYDYRMNEFWGSKFCMHPLDLSEVNQRARDEATQYFLNQRSAACRSQPEDSYNRRLDHGLNRRYTQLNEKNLSNNRDAVTRACSLYASKSEREPLKFLGFVFMPDGEDYAVGARHESAKREALELFNRLRRQGPHRTSDEHLEEVQQFMASMYSINHMSALSSFHQRDTRMSRSYF